MTNKADTGGQTLSNGQTTVMVSSDFTLTFTLNGVPYAITLANIGYVGSGGHVLALYFNCLLASLNAEVILLYYYSYCYTVFVFKFSLFLNWRALGYVS